MKLNLATKVTIVRLIIIPIIIILFLFDIGSKTSVIADNIVNYKYFIIGAFFAAGSATDFIDGYIARKYDQVTDIGKFLDPIADKLLVNSTLILLIGDNMILPIIGVVLIGRDIIVDVIRMIVANKGGVIAASSAGKFKTIFQMVGITFVLFYNLPFAFFNIPFAEITLFIAVFFSIYSGMEYYYNHKNIIFGIDDKKV